LSLDWQLTPRLSAGASYQRSNEPADPNLIDRRPKDSISLDTSYNNPDKLKLDTKLEYRIDTGDTQQILTNNSCNWQFNRDITIFGEYDYSLSRRSGEPAYTRLDIKQVGLAIRPVDFDWLNLLFKYLRYVDDRPQGLNSADGGFVKSNSAQDVYSAECAIDLPWHFQLVEKFAYKNEETISQDPLLIIKTPENLKATLYVHRLNFHLTKKWELAAEYRILRQHVTEGTLKKTMENGALVEINRRVLENLYVGCGYNFTSFTDNLAKRRHSGAKGFYFRVQGRY
jgi:hypothetical protein